MRKDDEISVSQSDAGFILDCLERRAQDWSDTARILRGELPTRQDFIPEECHKPEEAEWLATQYQSVYDRISHKIYNLK